MLFLNTRPTLTKQNSFTVKLGVAVPQKDIPISKGRTTDKEESAGVISRGAQGVEPLLLKFRFILGGSAPLKFLY